MLSVSELRELLHKPQKHLGELKSVSLSYSCAYVCYECIKHLTFLSFILPLLHSQVDKAYEQFVENQHFPASNLRFTVRHYLTFVC